MGFSRTATAMLDGSFCSGLRVVENIGAGETVPNADPGGSEAGEVPLNHSSARAVAALRLLMTISLDLETPMKIVQRRRLTAAGIELPRGPEFLRQPRACRFETPITLDQPRTAR
jgi:hypothetical protein